MQLKSRPDSCYCPRKGTINSYLEAAILFGLTIMVIRFADITLKFHAAWLRQTSLPTVISRVIGSFLNIVFNPCTPKCWR